MENISDKKERKRLIVLRNQMRDIVDYLDPSGIKGPNEALRRMENCQKALMEAITTVYPKFARAQRNPAIENLIFHKKVKKAALTIILFLMVWVVILFMTDCFGRDPKSPWQLLLWAIIPVVGIGFIWSFFLFFQQPNKYQNF
ncbi:MAG: hypothetical protein PHQ47_00470 [Candidatus Portnoybacteria bacterium]|nr:hypothetical protein [Candidatus Portnoybacteria bacterium]